jgi:perosamine synthetase
MDVRTQFEIEKSENIRRQSTDAALVHATRDWMIQTAPYKYTYNFTWAGLPVIQFPQDLLVLQEVIWQTRPDLIIETGIAHGGSLVFYASMLELLGGTGRVVGVDIEIRPHNRKAIEEHALAGRISMIEGPSTDDATLRQVREHARGRDRVMVILDSNHTHDHVLAELALYSPLVTEGNYLVVLDTSIEDAPDELFPDRPWRKGNNPKTAVREFLSSTDRFEVDQAMDSKALITAAPGGYLKCMSAMKASERVPISGPSITQKEIDYVTDAVTNAWYANANLYNDRFERRFADYIGVSHALALPSCTSGIHLALLSLGIGPGDEVIVPEITWIASTAPICYVGATPVFADVEASSWCLDPASFERAITPRTKAVVVVDLYGNVADYEPIAAVARKHGVAIIEDAAQSIGAERYAKRAGSFGDAGIFSFHGSKTLTTGEGGMLVTNDARIHQRALILRDHGRVAGDPTFFNRELGYKYRMSSMQAALGLAQLERVDDLVARKRDIFGWYERGLAGVPGITLNDEPPASTSTFWMTTVIIDPSLGPAKETVMTELSGDGIDARPFFYPLSSLPAFAHMPDASTARERNPVSYRVSPCGVNLPSGLNLTPPIVDRVCRSLKRILAKCGS